jgi:hypothetical protein
MSYTQNNPLSRKNSPLNKDDKWIQTAFAGVRESGNEGVCTGDKFGGPTCEPGSKRYNMAKTLRKINKGGPSRESSEEEYMPIEDDMHKRGEGDMGMSRQPYGGNKGDEKRSVRDYEGVSRQPYGGNKGDEERSKRDYEGVSRQPYGGNKGDEKKSVRDYEGPSRKSSSPLNNTGMTGLNYSKELRYNAVDDITQGKGEADYGFSRESSSPLNTGSWAYEDAKRAEDLYEKGDYAHARALGIDEHDADYAKHWHKDEAEHGVSRKSRSERLRDRAMRRSERSGAEWGDYDYEDKRVQKMLSKASELDERSGNKYDKKGADIGRFLGRMTMTKKLTKAKPKSGGPR